MIAEGPAIVTQVSAPNNQPEPMIEPSDDQRSPRNPTLRSRFSALRLIVGSV
jgi:hypothetical protein